MRHLLARLVALVAVGVMSPLAPGLAQAYSPPPTTDDCTVDYMLKLPDGQDDIDHWATFVLAAVGVPDDEAEGRIVERFPLTGPGAWLCVTSAEALEIDDLMGRGSLATATGSAAYEVSIPTPVNGDPGSASRSGNVSGPGDDGTQIVPTWLNRIEAPEPDGRDESTSGVIIAILDTGVDVSHQDLNVVGGYNCMHDERGPDGWGIDGHGHGTLMAGIVAAHDNDRDTVGVLPGAAILSIPVLGMDGSGSSASVACGIEKAVELGATVASLSLGGTSLPSDCGTWDPYRDVFCTAHFTHNLPIVVSAGNDASDSVGKAPANYGDTVISVSALTDFDGLPGGLGVALPACGAGEADDTLASFSNWGSFVDIGSPAGVCAISSLPGNERAWVNGTSPAAPLVAGVIAAWIVEHPGCPDDPVKTVLRWSEEWNEPDLDGWWDGDIGPDHEPMVRYGAPCYSEPTS
jgi:subtilisin